MRRALLTLLVLAGCDDYGPKVRPHGQTTLAPTTTPTVTVEPTSAPDTVVAPDVAVPEISEPEPIVPIDIDLGEGHPVIVIPPPVVPQGPTRPRRRMDIDQLDRAILQATGRAWTQTVNNREVNQFQALSETLGKPDFTELTQEDLSPSTLFQKFLDEAARTTCDRLVAAEAAMEDGAGERILFRHATPSDTTASAPAAIDKNLAYLVLRFHGQKLGETDPGLEPWRWLFQSALHVSPGADGPLRAWRTVCVGLIVHPAFYTY